MTGWIRRHRGFLIFLLTFGVFRTAVADWNPIPSASMRPTLLEGDVVLVNRLAYDLKLPLADVVLLPLGTPRRGDVVTFSSPVDGTRLIKRLVGLPGDVVEMRDGRLVVNGEAAAYRGVHRPETPENVLGHDLAALRATEQVAGDARVVQFLPAVVAERQFGPLRVPPGEYFFLGDNRDNSGDSRVFGTVPRHLLIGRAHHLLVSVDMLGHWLPRLARFGQRID
jgi:signal peptidase I